MDGGDDKAALLIEAQGVGVVVGGDEPQPAAANPTGGLRRRFDERAAHAQPLAPRIQRDDFAGFALDVKGQQAGDFILEHGGKPRQFGGAVDFVVRDDGLRTPGFGDAAGDPVAVGYGQRAESEFRQRLFLNKLG